MSFIYKTTNMINGMIYIGKTKNNDGSYLGSGLKITKAIKKYGRENFSKMIIEECDDSIVNQREIFWIKEFNSTDATIGYNLSKGGEGGSHYWDTLTEDQRLAHNEKISKSRKGKLRGPHSAETKKKMSINFNRDPDFLKARGKKKCKEFTCVDHSTQTVYTTNDLKQFCIDHSLVYANMLYNASKRKNFTEVHWSCRKGILEGDVISMITLEVNEAQLDIKQRTGKYNRTGCNNPMFGRKHTQASKNKIRERKLNQ